MTQSTPDPTMPGAAPMAPAAPATSPVAAPMAAPMPPPTTPPAHAAGPAVSIQKQGPWMLWILSFFLIPYVLWYGRINKELGEILGEAVPLDGQAIAVFIPLINIIGMLKTAERLNRAAAKLGAPVEVSGFKTLLAAFWFASQTRYLQRRMNTLADFVAGGGA